MGECSYNNIELFQLIYEILYVYVIYVPILVTNITSTRALSQCYSTGAAIYDVSRCLVQGTTSVEHKLSPIIVVSCILILLDMCMLVMNCNNSFVFWSLFVDS